MRLKIKEPSGKKELEIAERSHVAWFIDQGKTLEIFLEWDELTEGEVKEITRLRDEAFGTFQKLEGYLRRVEDRLVQYSRN